jgi:hypothetical protein
MIMVAETEAEDSNMLRAQAAFLIDSREGDRCDVSEAEFVAAKAGSVAYLTKVVEQCRHRSVAVPGATFTLGYAAVLRYLLTVESLTYAEYLSSRVLIEQAGVLPACSL